MNLPRHAADARTLLDTMTQDPDGGEALGLAYAGIRTGRWGAGYTAAIGQDERHGLDWPMEQVAAFTMVHFKIQAGDIAQVMISVRATPERDEDREANAAALADLPRPFRAAVDLHQDKHPGDGMLHWNEPIRVTAATGLIDRNEDGETFPLPLTMMIPPGKAVLEIGSTLASRTWTHLDTARGSVARWPYGESLLYLFVNLGPSMAERIAAMIPRKNRPAGELRIRGRAHAGPCTPARS